MKFTTVTTSLAVLTACSLFGSPVIASSPHTTCWPEHVGQDDIDWPGIDIARTIMYNTRHYFCAVNNAWTGDGGTQVMYTKVIDEKTSPFYVQYGSQITGYGVNTVDNCWYSEGELIAGCVYNFWDGNGVIHYNRGGEWGWDATLVYGGFWLEQAVTQKRDTGEPIVNVTALMEGVGNVTFPGGPVGGRIVITEQTMDKNKTITGVVQLADITVSEDGTRRSNV